MTEVDVWTKYRINLLAILVYYSTFKGLVPRTVDLTPLFLLIFLVVIFQEIYKNGVNFRYYIVGLFVVLQVIPLIYNITPELISTKLLRLFLATMPIMFLAASISMDRYRLKYTIRSLSIIGGVILILAAISMIIGGDNLSRGGFDAPILVSRSLLLLSLSLIYMMMYKNLRLFIGLPAVCIAIFISIQTQSRGPLLAFIAGAILLLTTNIKRKFKIYVVAGAILVGALLTYASPALQNNRITSVFSGNLDISSTTRLDAWSVGVSKSSNYLFGHGIGSFIEENVYGLVGGQYTPLEYPHNFIIEGLYGSGIVFVIFVILLLIFSAYSSIRKSEIKHSWIPSLLLFTIINALVSSDIPGNKEMWAFLIMSIPMFGVTYERGDQHE